MKRRRGRQDPRRPPSGLRPPRLPEAWLRRAVRERHAREGVIGDLWEEFELIARRRSAFAARLWYWGAAVAVIRRYRVEERRTARPPERRSPESARPRATDHLARDLRFAVRSLAKQPAFTAAVALTLALGIGANTVVFTVLDAVLLSPLPYADAERLVRLYQYSYERPERGLNFVVGRGFAAYRELDDVFEGLATEFTYRQVGADLVAGDQSERVLGMPISSGLFETLGVRLALGREFVPDDEGGARRAILSNSLWQRRFDADPEVLGRGINLDGVPYDIVGVAPAGFRNPLGWQVDLWTPENLRAEGRNSWDNNYLSVVGRLREGVTVEQATARLDALSESLAESEPEARGMTARLVPLLDDTVGDTPTLLYVLTAAVAMVLLVACVNVAGLLLARGADRGMELAVRAAMGAGRRRLMSQMLAESLLLGVLGGALGLLLSFVGVRLIVAADPGLPRLAEVGVDLRILMFTLGVSMLTALVFGISPALQLSRPDLEATLRAGGRGHGPAPGRRRMRDALVVVEVALAVVLLVGAGLLIRSFAELLSAEVGFRAAGVLTYEVHLPGNRYSEPERRIDFFDRWFARVGSLPGVEAVGAISYLPTEGRYHRWNFSRPDIAPEDRPVVERDNRMVAGAYFEAMGIELLRGRLFGPQDAADGPGAVILNRYLAERAFPDRDPLGATILQMGREWEVVGIVGDTAYDPQGSVVGKIYYPHEQFAWNRNWALIQTVRSSGDPASLVAQLRAALRAIDAELILYRVRTMNQVVGAGISSQRFAVALMGAFAGCALVLAALGIYGVLSYSVARRTREIGIRMALGADTRRVRRLVTRRVGVLTLVGIASGVGLSLMLARWLSSLLFQVQPNDPWVLAAVITSLASAAALSGYLPARRATRLDPLTALHDNRNV